MAWGKEASSGGSGGGGGFRATRGAAVVVLRGGAATGGENSSGSDLAALLFDGANRMACARMEKQAKRGRGGVKKGQSGPGSEAGAAAVGGEDRQWPKRRRAAAPLFWAEVEEGTVGRPSCKKEKG